MSAHRLLEAARFRLCLRYPFIARAVFAMTPVFTGNIPAAIGVDRNWRLFVNPDLIDGWSVEHAETVLYHEVLHLILDHAGRADALGIEPHNARAWNCAADAEINDDIRAEGFTFPPVPWRMPDGQVVHGPPVFPEALGQPPGLLAETYYHALPTVTISFPGLGQEGSGVTGSPADWEPTSPSTDLPDGLPSASTEIVRRAVAEEVRRAAGRIPGCLERWAAAYLAPRIDWRQALRVAIRRAIATGQGQVDYRYDRPSRRQAATDVILPRLRAPIPKVLLVFDTSGSIDDTTLHHALAEIEAVVRALGTAVDVATGDAELQTFQRGLFRADRVRARGGGGTDLGAVLQALERRGRWDVAVVFTDGETPWPERRPLPCPVLVVLPAASPQPPAWARVTRIPSE
uniref:Metal-dependent peptidase n=1 Tax=Thermorudis peleae TaxID=1382356 RepID=A0A831X1Z3_9BACT